LKKLVCLLLLLCCAFQPLLSWAKKYPGDRVFVALEQFQWREFVGSDQRVVLESGPRLRMGVTENNLSLRWPGIVYDLTAGLQLGQVDYLGDTQFAQSDTAVPFKTSTDYLGYAMSALIGQRYGYVNRTHLFDLMGGVSLEGWFKTINASIDEQAQPVNALGKSYRVVSGLVAMGFSQRERQRNAYFRVGIKYPLVIQAWVTEDEVKFHPGKNFSGFASIKLVDFFQVFNRYITITVFFDSYRFGQSNVKAVSVEGDDGESTPTLMQHFKSEMDVFGVSIAF